MADFGVANHGTIFLLAPYSEAAREWCKNHIPADAQTFGDSIVIEHRYIQPIARGIVEDGFDIEDM
jgi:hypothetical protein